MDGSNSPIFQKDEPIKQQTQNAVLGQHRVRIQDNNDSRVAMNLSETTFSTPKTIKDISASDLAKANIEKNTNPTEVLKGSAKLTKIYIQNGGTLKNLMKGLDDLMKEPLEVKIKAISNLGTAIEEKIKIQREDRSIIGRITRFFSQLFGFSNINRAKELQTGLIKDLAKEITEKSIDELHNSKEGIKEIIKDHPGLVKEFASNISKLSFEKRAEYHHWMNGILEQSSPELLNELEPSDLSKAKPRDKNDTVIKGGLSPRATYMNKLYELEKRDLEDTEKNTKTTFKETAKIREYDNTESPVSQEESGEVQIDDESHKPIKKQVETKYSYAELINDESKINEESVAYVIMDKINFRATLVLEDLLNRYVDQIASGKQKPTIEEVMKDLHKRLTEQSKNDLEEREEMGEVITEKERNREQEALRRQWFQFKEVANNRESIIILNKLFDNVKKEK